MIRNFSRLLLGLSLVCGAVTAQRSENYVVSTSNQNITGVECHVVSSPQSGTTLLIAFAAFVPGFNFGTGTYIHLDESNTQPVTYDYSMFSFFITPDSTWGDWDNAVNDATFRIAY